MQEEGLKLLAAARDATGLAIVTEVMTPHHVELVAKYADVLQIGARNMQNYHLLAAAGEDPQAGSAEAGTLGHDGRVPAGG
jgi:3-deoxy-7-phosphoheptulonate synthase